MAGDPQHGEWPRYDEILREGQAERGWIASEVRHLTDAMTEVRSSLSSIETRVRVMEQRHNQEDVVKTWAGKALAAFWILVGALSAKALEYFLSHRPILVAIGASAIMLAAAGMAQV